MGRLSSDFPNAQAVDAALKRANKAEVDVANLTTAMAGKVDYSDYQTETRNLQGQIDQIVISASSESVVAPEVAQARVDADGMSHQTLKERLDTEENASSQSIAELQHIGGLVFYDSSYIDAYGNVIHNGGRLCTDFIICNAGQTLSYVAETDHANISAIAFYDDAMAFLSGESNVAPKGELITTVVPDNARYCRLSTTTAILNSTRIEFENSQLPRSLHQQTIDLDTLEQEIIGLVWNKGYVDSAGVIHDDPSDAYTRRYSELIPCPPLASITYVAQTDSVNISAISFYDEGGYLISTESNVGPSGTPITTTTPNNTRYCRLCTQRAQVAKSYVHWSDFPLSVALAQTGRDIGVVRKSVNSMTWNVGLVHTDGKIWSAYNDRRYSNLMLCSAGDTIEYAGETNHNQVNGISFYNASFEYISGESQVGTDGVPRQVTVPEQSRYFRISTRVVILSQTFVRRNQIPYDNHIVELLKAQNELPEILLNERLSHGLYSPIEPVSTMNRSGCTFNSDGSITIAAGGYYFPVYPSAESTKGDVIVRFDKDFARVIEIAPNSIPSGGGSQPYIPTINYDGYAQLIIKKSDWDAEYPYMTLRFDNRNGTDEITIGNIIVADSVLNQTQNADVLYVSTQGDDSGDGTAAQPLATVNAALSRGAHSILIESGVYNQKINLSLAKVGTVTIRNASVNERVIFTNLDNILATTETPVSDHPTVFSASCAYAFADTNRFIWIDNVSDVATMITDSERHPLERGKEYRCEDTRLIRCSATTLSAALQEIESASDYRWFYDSDANLVYFSRPVSISSEHPLRYSAGDNLFQGNSKKTSVIISGIETKYIKFNLTDIAQAYASDCRAANIFGSGCFTYDHTRSITFLRCEATNAQSGSNGDGFNAHSFFSGDAFAKQTTVTLIDCWSHDNNDDGYSDHERSETTIIGGLYEYNRKGGVTPSYGSHCTCYGVYSRNNYSGFYYTGAAEQAEGGKYGQMFCVDCLAEHNRGGGQQCGFVVDGIGNTGKCVSCKAIDNGNGYKAGTGCTLELIDCGAEDNTIIKSGTVIVKNTTLVI